MITLSVEFLIGMDNPQPKRHWRGPMPACVGESLVTYLGYTPRLNRRLRAEAALFCFHNQGALHDPPVTGKTTKVRIITGLLWCIKLQFRFAVGAYEGRGEQDLF